MISKIATENVNTVQTAAKTGTAKSQTTTSFAQALNKATSSVKSLDDIFEQASDKYGVDAKLLKAVAKAESGFQTDAVSSCGAQGVMQLMPSTAASLGVHDSFDAQQNIDGGAKYLSGLINKYGDAKLALAAYNAGSGNVDKYGGVPPFKETQNYVRKVMSYAGEDLTAGSTQISASAGNSYVGTDSNSVGDTGGSLNLSAIQFTSDDYKQFLQIFAQQIEQSAVDKAYAASGSRVLSSFYSEV